jgi:hypothetical protein
MICLRGKMAQKRVVVVTPGDFEGKTCLNKRFQPSAISFAPPVNPLPMKWRGGDKRMITITL